ncbi:hypothetical protein OEA41_009432 [Lepraria neglecta]|uniref:Uncharacterized protein n=1 Tax=Lepraria neglecta TaxID=209136 RepID=A0AAD9Z4V0_9LECA|nr:hypothetical protein OEA41_009432 [Lepraria neglecta]
MSRDKTQPPPPRLTDAEFRRLAQQQRYSPTEEWRRRPETHEQLVVGVPTSRSLTQTAASLRELERKINGGGR